MRPARSISPAERRARLGTRHGLADPRASVEEAVDSVVVLHASDPASVFLSAMARLADPSIRAVERALYQDRTLVRVLAMRRTLFVCPIDLLEVVERSSTNDVAPRERARLEQAMADSGFADPGAWMAAASEKIQRVLAGRGLGARRLTAEVPMLATKLQLGAGTKWGVEIGATSRVLGQLAMEGVLIRGRPAGNWTGRQYHWHLRSDWLAGTDPDWEPLGDDDGGQALATREQSLLTREQVLLMSRWAPMAKEEASAELVRRWLARFGPGTFNDLKWWTGWRVAQLRQALSALDVAVVDLDGKAGLVLADDLAPVADPEPWAALLPALDPTPMGWKERDWYLGPHQLMLFDRNGNIGPTVWVDGRVVGGWAQRPDGTVVAQLLEDVGSERVALVEAQVERLQQVLGDTAVKPSFPTPLQRTLADSE